MLPDLKTMLVVNPNAGKGRGARVFSAVRALLEPCFPGLALRVSTRPGQAFDFGSEARAEGYGRILCVGGDGTPFEVVNGFYAKGRPERPVELGMIPAGTGNSFLRDFSIHSWRQAVQGILDGKRRQVDLVQIDYGRERQQVRQYYLNIMGVGLIADILKLTNEKLKGFGRFSYGLAVLLRLARGMHNRMLLTVDGVKMEIANSALVFSNSQFTGGAMKIAPMADSGDGRIDMVVFQEVNRRDILNIFARVFKGTHVNHPRVKTCRGTEISIDSCPQERLMADGELLGHTPLQLKVLPEELTVLA
ncbi:MAG: diacylglycerol kinase family lipid kinase [Acidobacteria bacterium]|jgi:YegS/Rv2252/BmrU family lipid kinase|nr:diacylglycerol kinase family lipid kinase [Acidobacteriota bacterium]